MSVWHNYIGTDSSAVLQLFARIALSTPFGNIHTTWMYRKASDHQTVQLTAGL